MIVFILRRFFSSAVNHDSGVTGRFHHCRILSRQYRQNVLGAFITPEQEAAFIRQNGLDQPMYVRYLHWIAGNDWVAEKNRHASEKNYDGRRI